MHPLSVVLLSIALLVSYIATPTEAVGGWPQNLSSTLEWMGYLALNSIFFFLPILFCLCCACCMGCSAFIRKNFMEEGRYLKKQVYFCCITFSAGYLVLIILSIFMAVVVIVNTISFMLAKDLGFAMGNHLVVVPKTLNNSLNQVFNTFDAAITSGRAQQQVISDLYDAWAAPYQDLTNARELLDEFNSELTSFGESMAQINQTVANMSSYSMTEFNVMTYNLGDSSLYGAMLQERSSLDASHNMMGKLRTQMDNHLDKYTEVIDAYENDVDNRFAPARKGAHTMFNSLGSFMDQYATDLLDNYDIFLAFVSILCALIICCIASLIVCCCPVNYVGIFKTSNKYITPSILCSCLASLVFLFTFACYLSVYIFVSDACTEIQTFNQKAETISEAQAFRDGFQNVSIDIDLNQMILEIKACDSSVSYLQAAGLDDPTDWTIATTAQELDSALSASLYLANVTLLREGYNGVHEYSQSLGGTPPSGLLDQLTSFNEDFTSFFGAFMLNTYNYSVSLYQTAQDNMDALLLPLGLEYSFRNIDQLNVSNPIITSNLTSSQISNLGEYAQTIQAQKVAINETSILLPLVDNYNSLQTAIENAQASGSKIAPYVLSYKSAEDSLENNVDGWISSYNQAMVSSASIAETLESSANRALRNATQLDCGPMGTFFTESRTTICVNYASSTIASAVLSVLLALGLIYIFFTLLCTHYRIEYLSEVNYQLTTVKPFRRKRVGMGQFVEQTDIELPDDTI